MSQGIVSGTSRQLGILGRLGYENFIQTDAAINPGNSGGPLTNIHGEVVGMNTAIATRTGANNGLGFAIPADMIRQIVDQLINKGKVSRGYLGVFIRDVDAKIARSFNFKGEGVLVDDFVDAQSPAAKAGLWAGDIITHVNGDPVSTSAQLRQRVAAFGPGEKVKVTVFREGATKEFTIKLTEAPTKLADVGKGGGKPEEKAVEPDKLAPLKKLGLENLSTLTRQRAEDLGLEGSSGVLIEEVRSGSVAYAEGLRPGVIITEVQGKAVKSVEELAAAFAQRDLKEGVRLRVKIENVSRFVFLALPE
jgi:serine protease Do